MLATAFAALGIDAKALITSVGLLGVFAIVFAESGLLIGFFLPGDALLFTAGFFASGPSGVESSLHFPLIPLIAGIAVAAVAGDQVGYLFGRKAGSALFTRPDSRLFKHENLEKASEFFDKHGPKTIVLARYVPIVRTFAPIVAGASGMKYRTFVRFNVLGGVAWAILIPMLGYWLGQIDVIAENIELAVIAVVAISLLPMVIELIRHRRTARAAIAAATEAVADG
ncbi:MAG: VTT domain-containing protein [Acidimicrobiales bacterium]